jgi:hypothetical protein
LPGIRAPLLKNECQFSTAIRAMKKGVMAHWDEERDRRRIEQVRDIRYIPKDLIKRYELIGDIYD